MGPVQTELFSQSFTIHGLWPSQNTDQYYGDFDFNLFRGTPLLQEMYNYWPPQPKLGGLPHFLWEFEWSRNGNRYADLMMNLAPGNFNRYGLTKRNEQLQIDYFQKVIELFKKLNVRGLTQKSYTRK
jgi:ribonuclease I